MLFFEQIDSSILEQSTQEGSQNDAICLDFSLQITDDDCVRVSGEIVNLNKEKEVPDRVTG